MFVLFPADNGGSILDKSNDGGHGKIDADAPMYKEADSTRWLRYHHDGVNNRMQNANNRCRNKADDCQGRRWIGEHIEQSDNQIWQNVFHVIAVSSAIIRKSIQQHQKMVIIAV